MPPSKRPRAKDLADGLSSFSSDKVPITLEGAPSMKRMAMAAGCIFIELAMLILFMGTYLETLGLMSHAYLSELPLIGGLFGWLDPEMTISHLLAFLLAIFSVAVPLFIWSVVLDQKVYENPQGWISDPTNRVYAILAAIVYGLVFALETVNLYTLIAQNSMAAAGPFPASAQSPIMEMLAGNQGLGVFIAVLIAVVNTLVALLTVITAKALSNEKEA